MFRTALFHHRAVRHRLVAATAALLAVALVSSCSGSDDSAGATAASATPTEAATPTDASGDGSDLGAVGTLDSSEVHEISVEFDDAEYEAMIETYSSSNEKDWIEATVTIDGVTYEQAGIRLKGNSSLRSIAGTGGGGGAGGPGGATGPGGLGGDATTEEPETLPWLIKLDKYVEGQSHEGLTDLVVRSNSSETSLNDAVALELLERAGLASQDAIATSFSVNGSDAILRLVIDHPDDVWMSEVLDADGALYKAESTGDYSFRGDDEAAYEEVFDQEAGTDNTDLTPLIEFLDFINNADDATFAAELGDRLDVDAFVTYLAMQELIGNFDDIDGPGNNSYLYWDADTGLFTVVPWDHNLAFGGMGGMGGMGGPGGVPADADGEFTPPADGEFTPPADGEFAPPGGDVRGGAGFGRSNILVQRFLADASFEARYEAALTELRAELYDSGVAADVLAQWAEIVDASGLVEGATVVSEAAGVATFFS